jgi:ankyrin repeat protein
LAVEEGDLEMVKLLLEHANNKNPADKYGMTPLHWAAWQGELEILPNC